MERYVETRDDGATRSLSIIVFLSGIWLMISPFILNYSMDNVQNNQFIFGLVIAVLAIIRYFFTGAHWASWLAALAGLWMIIAPYAMSNVSTSAKWASVIGGIVAVIAALANATTNTETHYRAGHQAT